MNSNESHSPPPPYSAFSASVPLGFDMKVPPVAGSATEYPPVPQLFVPTSNITLPTDQPLSAQQLDQNPRIISAMTATYGPFPVEIDCPFCQKHIVTHTRKVPGILPWIMFVACFVLGFILLVPWCFCCLPFCVDSCLDVLHNCPSCKRLVGKFSRL